jgi:hypothetical protein
VFSNNYYYYYYYYYYQCYALAQKMRFASIYAKIMRPYNIPPGRPSPVVQKQAQVREFDVTFTGGGMALLLLLL